MTIKEFESQINRLEDVFGKERWNKTRVHTLWYAVMKLSNTWFKEQVDIAILSSTDRFDFNKAIQAEKNRLAMEKRTKEIIEHEKLSAELMTDEGFNRVLNGFQAKSLIEAMENARKMTSSDQDLENITEEK